MTGINDKRGRARAALFGNLLGDMLDSQKPQNWCRRCGSPAAWVHISLREEENPRKRERLHKLIGKLTYHAARAFSLYFSLANIAEEAFQHQQRRRMVRVGGPLWTGSFDRHCANSTPRG